MIHYVHAPYWSVAVRGYLTQRSHLVYFVFGVIKKAGRYSETSQKSVMFPLEGEI